VEGDDYVVDAVCPTTAAQAAALEPWVMSADCPSHSEKVAHYHMCDDELCNNAGGDVEITFEQIAEHHAAEWAALKNTSE
jgi:hypothetical protein